MKLSFKNKTMELNIFNVDEQTMSSVIDVNRVHSIYTNHDYTSFAAIELIYFDQIFEDVIILLDALVQNDLYSCAILVRNDLRIYSLRSSSTQSFHENLGGIKLVNSVLLFFPHLVLRNGKKTTLANKINKKKIGAQLGYFDQLDLPFDQQQKQTKSNNDDLPNGLIDSSTLKT